MQTEVDMETHQEYSKNTECERHQREDDQLLKDQNVRAGTNQSNLNHVMSTTSKGFNVDIVKMLENMTKIRREPENNHQEGNKLLYAYAAAVISVIVCILIYVVLITENYRVNIDINKVTMGSEDHVSNWNLNIIPRSKWQSKQPLNRANKINYPVHYVIIHHTATSNCSSHDECKLVTQSIQTFHIQSKHWRDIGYNFLVGGDGFVYEGRGWGVEGTHTYRYNAKSIGIAFIGIFDTTRPPERQIVAAQKLIQNGVELGYIVNDYILFAKLQESKRCSGLALLHLIKTWKNWNEKLSDCNIK
ncbi:PREDICTED: peptidoglycan-recognition protein SC2-like [Nicrophorus vespilloides]|uniref:Peptidoglycan-recognition protein SC2-like n=1 Tax=Nicrophorus vespilloides TaxID=110193 RepID=A0ABM1MPV2_NICVS|nr:PREDICTED: peptidoglycan-recognition protein SC2-like [Nicrophorus vespilloides]